MKKINLFILLIVLASGSVYAQDTPASPYVFPSFVNGWVYFSNGDSITKPLNYNAVTEEIVFQQNASMLALDNLDLVRHVIMKNHDFVRINNRFYEKVGNWADGLFVQYQYRVIPPSAPAAYGSDGGSTSATNLTSFTDKLTLYRFNLPDNFRIVKIQNFYLNKEGTLHNINKLSQVTSLFPQKAAEIKAFVKAQKLKFDNVESLQAIIGFCYK